MKKNFSFTGKQKKNRKKEDKFWKNMQIFNFFAQKSLFYIENK